jgi:hypothetical protein
MLQSITQRKRYGQSNPVTSALGEASKAMRMSVKKLQCGASPLQQAAAAAAAAERIAQQELAAAEQRQTAATAAAAAFPQPNAQQRSKAAAADAAAAAKAQQGKRSTRSAEQQQEQQDSQQQQPASCGWAVHHLNAFILQQLFSDAVGRSLTMRNGQVYDSILLLMGLAGEPTAEQHSSSSSSSSSHSSSNEGQAHALQYASKDVSSYKAMKVELALLHQRCVLRVVQRV